MPTEIDILTGNLIVGALVALCEKNEFCYQIMLIYISMYIFIQVYCLIKRIDYPVQGISDIFQNIIGYCITRCVIE